jgi:hypothetical protein
MNYIQIHFKDILYYDENKNEYNFLILWNKLLNNANKNNLKKKTTTSTSTKKLIETTKKK